VNDDGERDLDAVFRAWAASPDLHELSPGASDATIRAAESELGFPLPASLVALYRFSDGLGAVENNLVVQPVDPAREDSILGWTEQLPASHWPIPEELLVIGGNGAGEVFGLWRPEAGDPTPVVMGTWGFDPPTVALVGTSLPAFLRWWTGYYLALVGAPEAAFDALGMPAALRDLDEHAGWAPYVSWADQGLPDHDPDPYARGIDPDELDDVLAEIGHSRRPAARQWSARPAPQPLGEEAGGAASWSASGKRGLRIVLDSGETRGLATVVAESVGQDLGGFLSGERTPPVLPRPFRRLAGRRFPDLLRTEDLQFLISERAVDVLRDRGITGFTTYPVEIHARREIITGHVGLVVTGRCTVDWAQSEHVLMPPYVEDGPPVPMRRGFVIVDGSWTGTDLALVERTLIVVATERVAAALSGLDLAGVVLTPLEEYLFHPR
jgi:hypothetical protein